MNVFSEQPSDRERLAASYEAHIRYLECVVTAFSREDNLSTEARDWYNNRIRSIRMECHQLKESLQSHQVEHAVE